jgi:hypothetical protein
MSDNTMFLTRRQFVSASATALGYFSFLRAGESSEGKPWAGPAVVKKVYLAGARPSWPRPDVDLNQDVAAIEAQLAELERRYPGRIRFTGGELIRSADEMKQWMEKVGEADAVLAFNMVTIILPLLRPLVESGKPTLMFARPYAGHDWTHAAAYMQKGMKLDLIASSDFEELDAYVPLFGTIHHLRHSKVLLVAPPAARPKAEGYTQQFGTAFAYPTYLDLKAAHEAADVEKARKLGDEFIQAASRVVEPGREEIIDSVRLYLALEKVLEQEKANAIAIDCLGGFARKELPAYPCIGFSKLNDAGLYGCCECDLESAMTQLLVTSFSGKPGFISDPVFDTSRSEVIHAHCMATTRMQGIGGPASPYLVRTHLEDHKGVSMQVLAPGGDAVTVARFANPKMFMLSTGEALGNVDDERGCRTKIRTRVKDARKLLQGWGAAVNTGPGMPGTRDLLHRVVFYGDHTGQIERLGRLTGFQIVREG